MVRSMEMQFYYLQLLVGKHSDESCTTSALLKSREEIKNRGRDESMLTSAPQEVTVSIRMSRTGRDASYTRSCEFKRSVCLGIKFNEADVDMIK